MTASVTDIRPPGVQATAGIYRALNEVMRKVSAVRKENRHQHGFKYVGHDDVTQALRDAMVEQGVLQLVSVIDQSRDAAQVVRVRVLITYLCVSDGSSFDVQSFGESNPVVKRDGNLLTDDLQIGKAVSYAVKVAQLKTFMLVGGFPDNEATPSEMEHKQGSRPAPVAPVKPSSDEQVRLLVQEYSSVSTVEALRELRRSISTIVSGLTEEQYSALERADRDAEARVRGG